jgi:putative polyhydroxyalkanoate system protein
MSDIKYVRSHKLSLKAAKAVAQKTADDLAEEYDLKSEWEGDTLHFRRSGVDGQMEVTPSQIKLNVHLGFLLRPFRAKFEEHIERHLDELLAAQPPKPSAKAIKVAGKSVKADGSKKA